MKLGGYASKEKGEEKKELKASLINKGSLQEGFLTTCSFILLFCKTGSRISTSHQPLLILWGTVSEYLL